MKETTLDSRQVIEASNQKLSPVKEVTFYPAQFPIVLREWMQGMTIEDAAASLELPPNQFMRLLKGTWRPSKEICRRMGLKLVYAIAKRAD